MYDGDDNGNDDDDDGAKGTIISAHARRCSVLRNPSLSPPPFLPLQLCACTKKKGRC